MSTPTAAGALDWLPDHQLHVLDSLGHIDDQMQIVAELIQEHSRAGTFDLRNDVVDERMHTVIVGVHPIPAAVSRGFGDIVSALRGVLEHTVFADVEHCADRRLTEAEERALEVPALPTSDQFEEWAQHKRRRNLPGLGADGELADRLRSLQPFSSTPTRRPCDYWSTTQTFRSIGARLWSPPDSAKSSPTSPLTPSGCRNQLANPYETGNSSPTRRSARG